MGFEAFSEHTILNTLKRIAAAETTTPVEIVTASGAGLRYDAITAGNDDAIAHTLEVGINDGGPAHYLGGVVVPAGAGQGAVPAVDVLAALQVGTPAALMVAPGVQVVGRVTVTMQAASILYITAVGGAF